MKKKKIIFIILILILCIAGTTIIFMDRIQNFLPSDEGAISLIPEDTNDVEENKKENEKQDVDSPAETNKENASTSKEANDSQSEENVVGNTSQNKPGNTVYHPGFEASDGEKVWEQDTQVEIFRISYSEDGSDEITIQSDNGDKLIAPGSENSYTFKLKNTGDVAMDYELTVDAYVTPTDIHVPVEARISRHDQTWVTGSGEEYVSIPELDGAADSYTLGSGRYSVYTLDWTWPFESGNDEWDTFLGNEAVKQDITLTIKINTVATVNANANAGGGMLPQTGDSANATIYVLLMASSILIFFLLLCNREKEEEGEQYE